MVPLSLEPTKPPTMVITSIAIGKASSIAITDGATLKLPTYQATHLIVITSTAMDRASGITRTDGATKNYNLPSHPQGLLSPAPP